MQELRPHSCRETTAEELQTSFSQTLYVTGTPKQRAPTLGFQLGALFFLLGGVLLSGRPSQQPQPVRALGGSSGGLVKPGLKATGISETKLR